MFFQRRTGFSLLELLFAIALLAFVMAGLVQNFIGMRKVQGSAVSQNLLRVAGQKAIRQMYLDLSQSRKLLASTGQDPAAKDWGREYFTIFQGAASAPAMSTALMQFPRIDEDGAFGVAGTGSGQLNRGAIGNTLVFATTAGTLTINPPLVTYLQGGAVPTLLTNKPINLPVLRFVAYYLIETPMGAGATKLPGNVGYTRQLVRWESQPYVERGEFRNFANNLVGAPATTRAVWDWLQAQPDPLYKLAGLWDGSAATAAASLYTVDGSGNIVAAAAGTQFKKRRLNLQAQTDLQPYALGMVAFNTGPNFPLIENGSPALVPAYALTDAAHSTFPYGFEVGMVGPSGARSVLLRLTLAARINQGLHLFGISQQEIVKVFDM